MARRRSWLSRIVAQQCSWRFLPLRLVLAAMAPFAAHAASSSEPAPHISRIVAFGDSYLDNGALLQLTRAAVAGGVPGARLMPGEPSEGVYPEGRWTNGPTAVEIVARKLAVPLTDYALGGAKSGEGNYDAWLDAFADSGLWGQVERYRGDLAGRAPDDGTVFLVSVSANDYLQFHDFRRAVINEQGHARETSIDTLATNVARNAGRAIGELVQLGARHIVVSKAYLLEAMPAVAADAHGQAEARHFREAYNRRLEEQIAQPWPAGVRVATFDWAAVTAKVTQNPAAAGFDNVTQPCQPTLPAPAPACAHADTFLWWDEWHETAHMHRIVAERLGEALQSVFDNP